MSRRTTNSTRRLAGGGSSLFGFSHSKSAISPLLSVVLVFLGAIFFIGYFYKDSGVTLRRAVSRVEVDYLSSKYLNKTLPELARVSSNGLVIFTVTHVMVAKFRSATIAIYSSLFLYQLPVVVDVHLGYKIPIIAVFNLDSPSKSAYKSGIDGVSRCFNDDRVKFLALVTSGKGRVVVVLVSEEEFKPVKTYLKKEEGLENAEFLYYASDADYKLEQLSFSINVVHLKVISEFDSGDMNVFENVLMFRRIFCLFVVPAILSYWLRFFSDLMEMEEELVDAKHLNVGIFCSEIPWYGSPHTKGKKGYHTLADRVALIAPTSHEIPFLGDPSPSSVAADNFPLRSRSAGLVLHSHIRSSLAGSMLSASTVPFGRVIHSASLRPGELAPDPSAAAADLAGGAAADPAGRRVHLLLLQVFKPIKKTWKAS
ncbi:hypothetical protein POM88_051553 [Heracleum sosnowskyi]|uniref:Uncharacterized protein n=1 Tax=Heracleum sosnowskyi TaxID=360622 RepID=A0AAD8GZQ3_9APIA|nr:hypothetical protein POM88_051553 [Heracleum sosnowskyi]